jgi:heme O synthase-like polyprenyltransferase
LNVVNLRLLTLIVRGLTGQRKISKGKLVAQVVIKFGGVLGVLAFLMLVVRPAPLPFLLGLSTVVAAVVLEGVFGIFRREG